MIEYKGISFDIEKEDNDYCFFFTAENKQYVGSFKTYDKALSEAYKNIDEVMA